MKDTLFLYELEMGMFLDENCQKICEMRNLKFFEKLSQKIPYIIYSIDTYIYIKGGREWSLGSRQL